MQKNNDFSMDKVENLPLVTIIVRTKNRPGLLQEALQSICEQTYPKIEIIVVNDEGNDVSEVVEDFLPLVSAIQLIQLSLCSGRSGAANEGLKNVSGEWAGFLDDDDLLEATHIEQLVRFALQNDAKVIYSGTKVLQVNQDGTNNEINEYNVPYSSERLLFQNFIPIHSALFNREMIDNGACFDTSFDFFEDWDFWLQLSQKTGFLHSPAVTAIYRLHRNASGVHQHENKIDPYLHIYNKWLSGLPVEKIFLLLQKSHQWTDDIIASLQDTNAKRLNEIGKKHSYAQQIIQERDAQLQERNVQLDEIGKKHSYAQQVVQERDAQLQELVDLYQRALEVIAEKEGELNNIKTSAFWPVYRRLLK